MSITPMVLLFTARGCPACSHARPEWERYKVRNPSMMALEFDADGPYAGHFIGKRIQTTPLYALKVENELVLHEGSMKAEQVEKWVKAAIGALE